MAGAFPKTVVRRRVYFLESSGLAYLANPKCASTSIKLALRRSAGETNIRNIHRLAEGSFVSNVLDTDSYDIATLEQAKVFSAVRNPYRRVLSAYIDKVEDLRPPWLSVCAEAGIEPKSVGFREFLEILSSLPPTRINTHFCPQWVNVLYPTKDTILLKLEEPDAIARFFHGHGMKWPIRANQGSTGTHRLEDYYDAETEALARRLYAEDFGYFGYPPGLDDSHLAGEPAMLPAGAPRLVDRVIHWRSRGRKAQRLGSPA
jgi:hypothetical protein